MARYSAAADKFKKVMGLTLLAGIVASLVLPLSLAGRMYGLVLSPLIAIAAGAFAASRLRRAERMPPDLLQPQAPPVEAVAAPARAAIAEDEARKLALDAVVAKLRESLHLVPVESLPGGGYVTDQYRTESWHLFYVSDPNPRLGASDYVAVNRATGEVRHVRPLGE